MSKMSKIFLIFSFLIVFTALLFQYHLTIFNNRKERILKDYKSLQCNQLGLNLLFGPEDITYSSRANLLFISSHNRRDMFNSIGSLFILDTLTDQIELLNITYPPYFRPHGISIYEHCESSSDIIYLFVISHRFITPLPHVIEKFSYTISTKTLKHLETLEDSLLVAPNDLIALNCNELLVSNDHYTSNMLLGLSHDIFKIKSADLLYYDGKSWKELNKKVAFGNGLILRQDLSTKKELLVRSSSADYSLLTYEITRSKDNNKYLESIDSVVSDETLPFSPDNIEYDVATGDLIITGHHSTELFFAHAIFGLNIAPSVVIQYHSPNNYQTLYYDNGKELSAASVATRTKDKKKLYIGQVFNPYILVCTNPE